MVTNKSVEIIWVDKLDIAVLEHHGDPQHLDKSIQKFITWRKQNRVSPSNSSTFNILYNNPDQVSAENYRLDLCVTVNQSVNENPFGIINKTIPAGRCAVLRYIGTDDKVKFAIEYLVADWLPQSGEQPRNFPIYLQRISFFPENQAISDIFLPLK
jgi:AraC family transcriptional regulator